MTIGRDLETSIIICTWNRATLLERTLASLRRLGSLQSGVEILLVDNNSSDGTPAIAHAATAHLPLRYLFEPEQGLSRARNRALREARGDLLLWIDDDVEVGTNWLDAYHAAALAHPTAAFFGGPIRPVFLAPPPAWLGANLDELGAAFAARDLGGEPLAIRDLAATPFGANMAIRRAALADVAFDPALGRHGGCLLAGEEGGLFATLLDRGHHGRWLPDAGLDHLMMASRLSRDFVHRYFHGLGRTRLKMNRFAPAGDPPSTKTLRRKLRKVRRQQWLAWRHDRHWAGLFRRRAELEGALQELLARERAVTVGPCRRQPRGS